MAFFVATALNTSNLTRLCNISNDDNFFQLTPEREIVDIAQEVIKRRLNPIV
jgi:hypothetical protein